MKSFAVGALAAVTATAATHPLDVIKVRKQLSRNITYKRLFDGLPDALRRQVLYSGIRFGLYDALGPERQLTFVEKATKGAFVGAMGAMAATPFDLAKVRKQAGFVHAPIGIFERWRGGGPTVVRAAIVTSSQLSIFHHAKEYLLSLGWYGNTKTNITASILAGIAASLISNPIDVMKTWRMTGRLREPQIQSLWNIVREDGVQSLYKGIGPTLLRMCPYVVILFLSRETYSSI